MTRSLTKSRIVRNGFNNRTSLTDSTGGTLTYSYNGMHQLMGEVLSVTGQNTPLLTFVYSGGRLTTIDRTLTGGPFNLIMSSFTYDSAFRLKTISNVGGSGLPNFSYTYNADSEVTNYTGPEGSLTYAYDHLGQLTGVSGARTETFGFDSNGNRNTTGYTTTTGNRMTADSAGSTFSYDQSGNLATKKDSAGNTWT